MWNAIQMAARDRKQLPAGKIISNPTQHGSSGGEGIKEYSSQTGLPGFPVIAASNEGGAGTAIKTATEDLLLKSY